MAVDDVYHATHNSSNTNSLPSHDTKEQSYCTPDAPKAVPHRPIEIMAQTSHNSLAFSNTPLSNEVEHNHFLNFNDPNVTYLPCSQEVTAFLYT